MWGMGGWSGSDDEESLHALGSAIQRGCNFFDTAVGLRHPDEASGCLAKRVASTHTPRCSSPRRFRRKNMRWPARPEYAAEET